MTCYTHQHTTRVHTTSFLFLSASAPSAYSGEAALSLRSSAPIGDLALKHLFVQFLIEMQPFENELHGRREHRRTFETFEPLYSLLQSSHTTCFLAVNDRRHSIRDFQTAARSKILQEGREIFSVETLVKNFLHRLFDQFVADLSFFPLFHRFEFNLTA